MITKLTLIALVFAAASFAAGSGIYQNTEFNAFDAVTPDEITQNPDDYPVRGEIRQTHNVARGADINVSGIEGPVEVETTGGSTVEVHFVREAKTQAEYDCETIIVLPSPTSFAIRHQTKTGGKCRIINAREHLKLTVPRDADLNISKIEGDFTVGETDGLLRLSWIEGAVKIGQTQATEIRWVEGGLSLNVARLSPGGIKVRDIEGTVELGLAARLNADLQLGGHSGKLQIDDLTPQTMSSAKNDHRLRLGTGGPDILLYGIEGGVRIFPLKP